MSLSKFGSHEIIALVVSWIRNELKSSKQRIGISKFSQGMEAHDEISVVYIAEVHISGELSLQMAPNYSRQRKMKGVVLNSKRNFPNWMKCDQQIG